jgi:flavin reductase (DIM6/NTAB) family NADH-FMN oxidoreductase RutF
MLEKALDPAGGTGGEERLDARAGLDDRGAPSPPLILGDLVISARMAISAERYKDVLRLWASGVTVVTTRVGGVPHGITVSSFASLSLDPPLVLVCVEKRTRSHAAIAAERCFGVHILRADQAGLSDRAAGRRGPAGNDLEGLEHKSEVTGAPILADAMAWLDCSLADALPGGDHTIFVGRVEAAGGVPGSPLLWYNRGYTRAGD